MNHSFLKYNFTKNEVTNIENKFRRAAYVDHCTTFVEKDILLVIVVPFNSIPFITNDQNFIQDTLTGIYNMVRDKCNSENIKKQEWFDFNKNFICPFDISVTLLSRNLNLSFENKDSIDAVSEKLKIKKKSEADTIPNSQYRFDYRDPKEILDGVKLMEPRCDEQAARFPSITKPRNTINNYNSNYNTFLSKGICFSILNSGRFGNISASL
ncbi:hypothetical protein U3516DRAFT_788589 [Neocallimastix sp. 'constans']